MQKEDNTIENTTLDSKIIETLRAKPGQNAREIAIFLNVDKKQINTVLYGKLKGECIQDEQYRWYLKENAPSYKKTERKTLPQTALARLSRYYLSCLGQNDEGGISVFADSKFGLDYVELDKMPLSDDSSLFESEEAQKLLGKMRKDRSRLEMYLGYPATLRKVKSNKSGWEGFFVEPILLIPIEVSDDSPKISHGFPIFNLSVIKRFTNAEREQVMDELAQLEDELGLTSENNISELDDLVQRLKNIRPEWPWEEEIEPDKLSAQPPLKVVAKEGIYNRTVLIVGERSPFTQGLESELKTLSGLSPSQYEGTVLGQWIKGQIAEDQVNTSKQPLLEVLPLNSEQRQAIQHSLAKSLTVITGPPGTGKSQVVTDLLINATWQGKKVLFASKNNKAVDVVEVRVNNLGARPVLLRMGSSQYQTKLAEYLMGLLTSTATEHDQEEFNLDGKKYKQLEEKLILLEQQESELIRLRNETDELDQSVEKIHTDVSPKVFNQLRKLDLSQFRNTVISFKNSLKNAQKSGQSFLIRLFWNFIKTDRYEKLHLEIENIKPIISKLEISLPKEIIDYDDIENWTSFLQTINTYLYFAQNIQEYSVSLKSLQEAKPLEDISKEKIDLMNQLANNAENLWKGWLRLQPARLTNEDRQLLNRYNALLKMVIDAGGDLYAKLGKRVYAEYSNLSKSVSHLLPAWAVTSLSARGKIPFEAGYFDIVIFDEASQCDIASALPLLYRAKQAVIIGDPKQLSHISGLQKGQDQQLLEKYNLIPDFAHWAYSYNSLFDLAAGLVSAGDLINLRDHHRSHADIIEFSNQEFYEGSLRVATNYDRLKLLDSEKNGIRWVNVVGSVKRPASGGAVNEIEAKAVVDELRKLIFERKYKGTIGVVTPFRAQANLIRQLVESGNDLSSKLINNDFLVDTVHKFQGDERDIMIFSPVVSNNMPEGALGFMRNNGNLFNVAITRARAMLLVVGDQDATIKCNVSYLENFARYIQQIEVKKEKQINYSTESLGEEYPNVTHPERVSDWEHIFYKALYKAGIKTIPQYQIEKYTLDLALFSNGKMLDIEIDGERYHRNWTGELCRRDQIRNQRLFELGWDVKRFWVYEVRDDIDGCVKRIKEWADENGK